jgi:hypothetical protein
MLRRAALPLVFAAAIPGAVAGCSGQGILAEHEGAAVVVTAPAAAMPESDHVPAHGVVLADAQGHEHRLPAARAAALWPRRGVAGAPRVLAVDDAARLVVIEGGRRLPLLDRVVGAPVVLDEGRALAARETEPGETDLWIVGDDGQPPRALAAAPGADDAVAVLPDGRVLFVSGRSGVAALWVVAADATATPRQLTNLGERPGALSPAFVPPPEGPVEITGDVIAYVDGFGTRQRVTLAAAEVR